VLIKLYLKPTFATWQCILFGADAAAVLLLLSVAMALPSSSTALKASAAAAAVAGAGIGFWTAQLQSLQSCPSYMRCPPSVLLLQRTFTAWQCALFGAGIAVVVLLLSFAVTRSLSGGSLEAT
jgi:hypothetical protein